MDIDQHKGESREEPLGFALGAAARKLAKFYTQALTGHSLTPSQLFLLRQLWLEDGLPLRDLALRAQLDATSTTWLVDQLERESLVKRKRNDTWHDGRTHCARVFRPIIPPTRSPSFAVCWPH